MKSQALCGSLDYSDRNEIMAEKSSIAVDETGLGLTQLQIRLDTESIRL